MHRMIKACFKFLRQPAARRGLLLEALLGLALARLALQILPFRRLKPFFTRPVRGAPVDGSRREGLRKEVSWVIEKTAKFLPGKTVCFPRGIVAQAMLRRRGVGTTLYYGVSANASRGDGSRAHVWVQDGPLGVVGFPTTEESYHILARYPEA
jgi:hypothetical protein